MRMKLSNFLDSKTIVITGGAGFIGSALALHIQEHYPKTHIIIIDKFRDGEHFPSGNPTSLGHFKNLIDFKGDIIALDINDGLGILKELKFDFIFHQAAISDTTMMNQKLMIQTNHHAFLELLQIALEKQAVVVYASSAGTYGNSPAPNIIGKGEVPENIYGFSKLAMDMSLRKILAHNPELPIIGLRYFNVYGPCEFYKGKTASMILQLGIQALRDKKVRLFEFGEQKRDFVYIEDVIEANLIAAFNASKKGGGIYNVGTGIARSYNDIVEILKKELDLDFAIEYIKNPYAFFQTHTQADITATRDNLGYEPRFTLEEGIKAYVPYIRFYEGISNV